MEQGKSLNARILHFKFIYGFTDRVWKFGIIRFQAYRLVPRGKKTYSSCINLSGIFGYNIKGNQLKHENKDYTDIRLWNPNIF